MKDSRGDFLSYITTTDGRLTDLVYQRSVFAAKKSNDHAHCELCWVTICDIEEPQYEKIGYYCDETGCWLCEKCFSDFAKDYNWSSQEGDKGQGDGLRE